MKPPLVGNSRYRPVAFSLDLEELLLSTFLMQVLIDISFLSH